MVLRNQASLSHDGRSYGVSCQGWTGDELAIGNDDLTGDDSQRSGWCKVNHRIEENAVTVRDTDGIFLLL